MVKSTINFAIEGVVGVVVGLVEEDEDGEGDSSFALGNPNSSKLTNRCKRKET